MKLIWIDKGGKKFSYGNILTREKSWRQATTLCVCCWDQILDFSEWLFFSLAKDADQLAFSLKMLELFLVTLQIRKFN